jgi:hypothetical protein
MILMVNAFSFWNNILEYFPDSVDTHLRYETYIVTFVTLLVPNLQIGNALTEQTLFAA